MDSVLYCCPSKRATSNKTCLKNTMQNTFSITGRRLEGTSLEAVTSGHTYLPRLPL